MEAIYLDHAATTPMSEEVKEAVCREADAYFGNPSSIHSFGRRARKLLDEARKVIAASIHASDREIIFTSGGTEADNMALIGTALARRHEGRHIITTAQEHHAVLHAAEHLEKQGFDVTYLPVYENGKISPADLNAALRPDTIVVSVMFANNETGVIQPIAEIAALLRDHPAYFHTDAVQAFGSIDMDVRQLGVDLLSVSGHKINGPKGIGFLYAAQHVKLEPLLFGGEQERKRRSGTENTTGAAGLVTAVKHAAEKRQARAEAYGSYKEAFLNELKAENVAFSVNGLLEETIPSTVNLSFPGTHVEQLLMNFDLAGVAAASGSACTAGSHEPSHVLVAMYGKEDTRTMNSVRFSFGILNTLEQSQEAARRIAKIIKRLV